MKINRFVQFTVHQPKKALAWGLLFFMVMSVGLKNLSMDFGYRIWFESDNPWLQEFDAFERRFGSDDSSVILVHSPSGVFDLETAELLRDMTADLWLTPDTIRVDSLANFQWSHADGNDIVIEDFLNEEDEWTPEWLEKRKEIALNHPSMVDYLVSKDAKTAVIYLRCRPVLNGSPNYPEIVLGRHPAPGEAEGVIELDGIRDILARYQTGDHEFHVTGGAPLNYAFQEAAEKDMSVLMPALFLITLVFLGFSLRSVGGGLLALLTVILSILVTLGFAGHIHMKMNNVTFMVPQFMIAIAVAVSAHILVTFVNFRRAGHEKLQALELTLQKNLKPTILTSLSTTLGFYSFTTAPMPPMAQMGIMAGTGTALAWVVVYFILGPLMAILPHKVKTQAVADEEDPFKPSARSVAFAERLYQNRFKVIALYVLVGLASSWAAFNIVVNSDPFGYFDKKFPLSIANKFIEEHIGGSMSGDLIFEAGGPDEAKNPEFLKKVDGYQEWLETFPFVSKTVSIVDIIKEVNKGLHGDKPEYRKIPESKEAVAQTLLLYTMGLPQGMDVNDRITGKNDAVRVTAMWTLHSSSEMMKFVDTMKEEAKRRGLGEVVVTGKNILWQSMNRTVVISFITSLVLALILISGMMVIGLRSVRTGAVAMLPNLFPLLFGAVVLVSMDWHLDLGTAGVASICLGIAVDDTIHFLANFSKYVKLGHSPREAVARVFTHTAPALVVTTVVLVASFGSFLMGSFVPNQRFGAMIATILSFALIMDLTLLPALLMTLPKRWFTKTVD